MCDVSDGAVESTEATEHDIHRNMTNVSFETIGDTVNLVGRDVENWITMHS